MVLDLRHTSAFTDVFVVCTGQNARQVKAIVDSVEEALQGRSRPARRGRRGLPRLGVGAGRLLRLRRPCLHPRDPRVLRARAALGQRHPRRSRRRARRPRRRRRRQPPDPRRPAGMPTSRMRRGAGSTPRSPSLFAPPCATCDGAARSAVGERGLRGLLERRSPAGRRRGARAAASRSRRGARRRGAARRCRRIAGAARRAASSAPTRAACATSSTPSSTTAAARWRRRSRRCCAIRRPTCSPAPTCSCRCRCTAARRRQRGFNQAHDLAAGLGPPVLAALRRRPRDHAPQTALTAAARRRNVRGAFALAPAAPWTPATLVGSAPPPAAR